MEPIPQSWNCLKKVYERPFEYGDIHLYYVEIYTQEDDEIIITRHSESIQECRIYYSYDKIPLVDCWIDTEQRINYFEIGGHVDIFDLGRWLPSSHNFDRLTFREENWLLPPVWNHTDYFSELAKIKIWIDVVLKECRFGPDLTKKFPVRFNWNTMRLYHKDDIFFTFCGTFCITVTKKSVDWLGSRYIDLFGHFYPTGNDKELESIRTTRIIFPAMDNLYKLIEQNLPQPIWEEILPHLLNPKQ